MQASSLSSPSGCTTCPPRSRLRALKSVRPSTARKLLPGTLRGALRPSEIKKPACRQPLRPLPCCRPRPPPPARSQQRRQGPAGVHALDAGQLGADRRPAHGDVGGWGRGSMQLQPGGPWGPWRAALGAHGTASYRREGRAGGAKCHMRGCRAALLRAVRDACSPAAADQPLFRRGWHRRGNPVFGGGPSALSPATRGPGGELRAAGARPPPLPRTNRAAHC